MNYKYRSNYLHEIMETVRNGHLLRELSNRRTKKSRKAAYIALKEFETLKDRLIIVERYGEGHNNDELIVKTPPPGHSEELKIILTVMSSSPSFDSPPYLFSMKNVSQFKSTITAGITLNSQNT